MYKIIIISLFFTFFSNSSSQVNEAVDIGVNIEGNGVRALYLGGAYTAVSDDFSALLWNPAGLTQMKKVELEISFHYLDRQVTTRYAEEYNTESASNIKLSSLAFAYPYPVYRGSLVFAIAFQRVKNYDMVTKYAAFDTSQNDYPIEYVYADGSPVNPFYMQDVNRSELISESGSLKKWSIGAAIDLAAKFSAGIGLHLYTGNYDYKNEFSQIDILNNYQSVALGQDVEKITGIRDFTYDFYGFEIGFGFLYHLTASWKLGGRVDLPLSFNVTEKYQEQNSIYFDDSVNDLPILGYIVYEGEDEYIYNYPMKFSLGSSYYLGNLLLSAQVDYRNWADIEIKENGQSLNNAGNSLAEEIDYRVGTEYIFSSFGLSVAAGLHIHVSPVIDEYHTSEINTYSIGLGYIFSRSLALNMGAFYSEYNDYSPGDDIMPQTASREFKKLDLRVGLKYHY